MILWRRVSSGTRSFPPDEKTELISDSAHTTRLSVSSQVHTSLMHFHPSLMHFPLKITRGWRTLMVLTAFPQQDKAAAFIHLQPKSIRQTLWYQNAFIWIKRPFWTIEWNCFIATYKQQFSGIFKCKRLVCYETSKNRVFFYPLTLSILKGCSGVTFKSSNTKFLFCCRLVDIESWAVKIIN